MLTQYRYQLGESGLREENPVWMRQNRIQKLIRPLAKIVNLFQEEPARDGMFLVRSDGSVINSDEALSTYSGPGDGRMLGEMAAADIANDPEGYGGVVAG